MRNRRSFRPTALSPLEDRLALSQVGIAPPAFVQQIPPCPVPVAGHVLTLNGTLSGTFVTTVNRPTGNLGAGTTTTFQGAGTISGLGQVKVTGTMSTLVTAKGQYSTVETFNLTNAQGSISLQLTSSTPKPGMPPTTQSSFSIVKATGAFQGDMGSGTASLQMISEAIAVVPPTEAKGIFTLNLHSNSPLL